MTPSINDLLALRGVRAGKVPPASLGRLFVGREAELSLAEEDLRLAEAGGATLRIFLGEPGAGKTFLLEAFGDQALRRRFVTMKADLTPDRLLCGRAGEGRALLGEATLRMQTLGSEDEIAMDLLVASFRDSCEEEAETTGSRVESVIQQRLAPLERLRRGGDFSRVIKTYASAVEPFNATVLEKARRWLTGRYSNVTEARDDLAIGSIVEEGDFWPMIRLWARFSHIAGKSGLLLLLDEARVLCRLQNPGIRLLNLEQILVMLNDIVQGRCGHLCVVIAGTPSLATQWNGMKDHESLNSCLLEGQRLDPADAARDKVVLGLEGLPQSQLYDLLQRYVGLIAACNPGSRLLPEEAFCPFLESCRDRLTGKDWRSPRMILQRLLTLHSKLAAYPDLSWQDLLFGAAPNHEDRPELSGSDEYARRTI